MTDHSSIIKENERRRAVMNAPYDPIRGIGSPIERELFTYSCNGDIFEAYLPVEMLKHPFVIAIKEAKSIENLLLINGVANTPANCASFLQQITKVRFKYDFEYWCYICHPIQDAESGEIRQFKLRLAQRKVWKEVHDQILNDEPIRAIVGKSRQWGGSTFANALHRWIQTEIKKNWHSAICADVEDQAKNIRGMSDLMYQTYPFGAFTLRPYQGSSKNRYVDQMGCIVGVGSMEKPDNLRSYNFKMLHLTEVGLWKKTAGKSPQDLAQSLRSQVKKVPWSVIILESTAKGVGNFFHDEWTRAINGKSAYIPIFVPWLEIEMYQLDLKCSPQEFYDNLQHTENQYGLLLWQLGATLEGINWYFNFKESENYDDWRMKSEFPSTWQEMFQSTGNRVFNPLYVANARESCKEPEFKGELFSVSMSGPECLDNIEFKETPNGNLWIWSLPDKEEEVSDRYCMFADIGGTSKTADYSCIKVMDRYWIIEGGVPEVVAVWHGHLDQDLFAWKCAQLAKFYNNAHLAIESNSLSKEKSEGDHFLTVLDEIAPYYDNLYSRSTPEDIRLKLPTKWGFHTNSSTKTMIINYQKKVLRERGYIERDKRSCDEMDTYEVKPDGTFGAVDGNDTHDDHVIITAGVNWLSSKMEPPTIIDRTAIRVKPRRASSEASF